MSNSFEWHTEEVEQWPEATAVASEPERPSRWRWLVALVIVCLAAVAGWVVYRQVDRRIAEATAHVEADVLSAHNVVRQAALQQDVELFTTMLSGRNSRWTAAQRALVDDGLLLDRASFGFTPAPANGYVAGPENITVTLASDLTAAEVTWLEPFVVNSGGQITETVALQQQAVYRQGARSWLLSPPLRDFWGEWLTGEGNYLTLVYPERDAALAERLQVELDRVLAQMCRQLAGIACPADWQMRLRLDNDPERLRRAANLESMLQSGPRLELPTPTLVGLPLDEAGYEVLYRGYAVHVVAVAITELAGYECCQHGAFYAALLDKQLSQLGLRPWPLTQADYDKLLDGTYSRNDVNIAWRSRSLSDRLETVDTQQLYALIDFLLAEAAPQATVAGMQRQLNEADSYWNWLRSFIARDYTPEQFEVALWQFVYQQTASAQSPLPIPLPAQDIQLVCQPSSGLNSGIYRFAVDSAVWSTEFEYKVESGFSNYVWPVYAQPHLYAVQEYVSDPDPGQRVTRLSLWRGDEKLVEFEQTIDETGRIPTLYFEGGDPTGRYLVMVRRYPGDEWTQYHLLDLESCRNLHCDEQPLFNWPTWSPGGDHTLMFGQPLTATTLGEGYRPWLTPLLLADARGRSPREVGTGTRPFWFTDERYGYIRINNEAEFELVTAVVSTNRPHVLLIADQLQHFIPAADRPQRLFLDYALANPANSRQLLIKAASSPPRGAQNYYFWLTLDSEWSAVTEVLLVHETDQPGGMTLSPDGRWLTFHYYGSDVQTTELVDLGTGSYKSFEHSSFSPTWSADGQWLAYNKENHLVLMAPAHDYRQLFFHEFQGCYRTDWVD